MDGVWFVLGIALYTYVLFFLGLWAGRKNGRPIVWGKRTYRKAKLELEELEKSISSMDFIPNSVWNRWQELKLEVKELKSKEAAKKGLNIVSFRSKLG